MNILQRRYLRLKQEEDTIDQEHNFVAWSQTHQHRLTAEQNLLDWGKAWLERQGRSDLTWMFDSKNVSQREKLLQIALKIR
jgi:hypothetical protein